MTPKIVQFEKLRINTAPDYLNFMLFCLSRLLKFYLIFTTKQLLKEPFKKPTRHIVLQYLPEIVAVRKELIRIFKKKNASKDTRMLSDLPTIGCTLTIGSTDPTHRVTVDRARNTPVINSRYAPGG